MTTQSRVVRNSLFNSTNWLINTLVSIGVIPVLVRYIGIERYGLYALLSGVVGLFGILDLGMSYGITKFVAEYQALKGTDAIKNILNTTLCLITIIGFIGSALLLAFAVPLITLLKVSQDLWRESLTSLYIIIPGAFLSIISGFYSSILMGLQLYDLRSKIDITNNILFNSLLIFCVILGGGLKEIAFLTTIFGGLLFLAYLILVVRMLPGWKFAFSIDKKSFNVLFPFSKYLYITRLWWLFSNYLVRFIISSILGPEAVTYYSIPSKLVNAIGGFLNNASNVVFPYASELNSKGEYTQIKKVTIFASKMIFAVAVPLHLFLIIFSRPILTVWVGQDFSNDGWLILCLLAISSFLATITVVPNLIVIGLGYSELIGKFTLFVIALYALLLWPFSYWWGVNGTSMALVICAIPGIFLVLYEIRSMIKIMLLPYLKEVLAFHLAPLIITIPAAIIVNTILGENPYLYLGIGSIGLFIYALFMVATRWVPLNVFLRGNIN